MNYQQLYDSASSTFSYLLWDPESHDAVLIDPVVDQTSRDIELIERLRLRLRYTLESHVHTDHVTGSGALRDVLNSIVIVHEDSHAKCADVLVKDGDFIPLGRHRVHILSTPGHTGSDISFTVPGAVFTGDTLLIGSCGRTDYQSGDAGRLYDSITQRLFTLPDDTLVFPGHDFQGRRSSTIGEEKRHNPRLHTGITRDEFIRIMGALRLGMPEGMHEALPSNLRCGTQPTWADRRADMSSS